MTEPPERPPAVASDWLPPGQVDREEVGRSRSENWLPVPAPAAGDLAARQSRAPRAPTGPAAVDLPGLGHGPQAPPPGGRPAEAGAPRAGAARRRGSGLRARIITAAVAAAVAAGVIVALAAGILDLSGTSTVVRKAPPAGPAAGAGAGAGAGQDQVGPAPSPVAAHGLRDPFVADGTRFAVFVDPHKAWTKATGGYKPAAGRRLVFVEVLGRRLKGRPVDLQALRYRLVTMTGTLFPLTEIGTGTRALGAALPRPPGGLVVSRLAFAVLPPLASLRLEFEPTNHGGPTIVVPLHG